MTKLASLEMVKSFAAFGMAAAAMLATAPAQAQTVTGQVPVELQVIRTLEIYVDRPLNFGSVVSSSGGVVSIAPNSGGARGTAGGVVLVAPSANPPSSAQVRLVGEADTDVLVGDFYGQTNPIQYSLDCSCGDSMDLAVNTDLPLSRIVRLSNPGGGAAGEAIFYIGGQAGLIGGEAAGAYTSVVPVSAAYY